ncbi:MAG: hypothetical protein CML23_07290 [Rhizobiaceae bacterium]|nr:hypothetical protein [Rhizobiaceae bacterium]
MRKERDQFLLFWPGWKWEALAGVVAAIGLMVAVPSFLFGIAQYSWHLEGERARETLEMIDLWEVRGYQDTFSHFTEDVEELLAEIPTDELQMAAQSERAANNIRLKIAEALLSKGENEEHFDKLLFFFNRLGLCVQAKLCSIRTAETFYSGTLNNFVDFFMPYILSKQDSLDGYAEPTLWLEAQFGKRRSWDWFYAWS